MQGDLVLKAIESIIRTEDLTDQQLADWLAAKAAVRKAMGQTRRGRPRAASRLEALRLAGEGLTVRQIAEKLGCSTRTVNRLRASS